MSPALASTTVRTLPAVARTNYDASQSWGDGKSGIETYADVAANNAGNLGDGQLGAPDSRVDRSQDDVSFRANESLELRNGCSDGSFDRGYSAGDLSDRAVGGNEVSCQSTSEMVHMGAESTYSIAQ